MRCKACDIVLEDSDLANNPYTGFLEELCKQCRDIVQGFEDEEDSLRDLNMEITIGDD